MLLHLGVLALAVTAACSYPPLPDLGGSNGSPCGSDGDCRLAGFPACEKTLNQGTCKPCTASNPGVCTGTTPRCENNACVACVDDVQDCKGGVCLATGDCADTGGILHAASTSTKTTNCGDAITPCSLNGALALVTSSKNVIKLDDPGPFTAFGFTISNDVTIDARGATLTRSDNGPILTINSGKALAFLGGILQGTAGKNSDGIKCNPVSTLLVVDTRIENNDLHGITADTCTLNVIRATISRNSQKAGSFVQAIFVSAGSITLVQSRIDSNNGGGLAIFNGAMFQIVGNVFSNNGPPGTPSPPSPVGGVSITTTESLSNRLDFNTIIGNHAQPGVGPGLQCGAGDLVVRNNIIYGNNDNIEAQLSGTCAPAYSDLGFTTIDTNNNVHVDPIFTAAFHLSAVSPLLGKADPSADLSGIAARDIDGDPRIKRPGVGADIGADQYSSPQ